MYASINFITAHDGYTLRDLVSYEQKHNEANGENNQDGHNDNLSRNWGVGGRDERSADRASCAIGVMRSFLATLAFSQGVPMIAHGDEIGRTQCGNNNAYAQDNEITWVNWDLDERQKALLEFTREAASRIRQAYPVLRRRHFFRGRGGRRAPSTRTSRGSAPTATELTDVDWRDPDARTRSAC